MTGLELTPRAARSRLERRPSHATHESLARRMTREPRLRLIVVAVLATGGISAPALGYALSADTGRRAAVAGLITLFSAALVAAAPIARMRARWFELLPVVVAIDVSAAILAFRPDGVIVMPIAAFLASTIAFVIVDPRSRLTHTAASVIAIAIVLAVGPTSTATWVAAACTLQCAVGLGLLVWLFWRPAEQQAVTLENIARRDPLTGVGNRRLLNEQLAYELERSERTGAPLALIVLDLDGFKEVNDTLGHAAGDEVLQRVGQALVDVARRQEVVTRPGGDEFCVIAPEVGAAEAQQLLDRLRQAVAEANPAGGTVTAAGGVAVFPSDALSADTLVEIADARQREDKLSRRRARERPVAADHHDAGATKHRWTEDGTTPLRDPESPSVQAARRRSTRWGVAAVLSWCAAAMLPLAAVFDAPGLHWVAGVLVAMALFVLILPAHRLNASWFQGLPLFLAVPIALAVFAAGDDGMTLLSSCVFVGAAVAFIADRTPVMVGQLVAASIVIAGAALLGSGTKETMLAVTCAIPVMWGITLLQRLPWVVAEEQALLLHDLARRDALTGVGNRLLLEERLGYELARHRRSGQPLSVLALDLNDFKAINDTAGHAAGDAALRDVADTLQRCVRRQDTVVRQGGDEFCVLAPETDADAAAALSEQLRGALRTITAAGRPVGGAIGHATCPDDGVDPATLLRSADARQRAAKEPNTRLRR